MSYLKVLPRSIYKKKNEYLFFLLCLFCNEFLRLIINFLFIKIFGFDWIDQFLNFILSTTCISILIAYYNNNFKPNSIKLTWYIYLNVFLMMFIFIYLSEYVVSIIPINGPLFGKMYKFFHVTQYPISFFLSAILFAPIYEEILFRGIFLRKIFKTSISSIKSIFFSALLFGIMHLNPWQIIIAFLFGIFIGIIYIGTRSISICIFLHAIYNSMQILHSIQILNVFLAIMGILLILFIILLILFIFQTKSSWKYDNCLKQSAIIF
ncbi:CPBP family intramembrane glutamic endopeptidase [Candidatus Walczuchella monophlebidarum]|uniref:Putative CAAX amino terminal protease family protein n=1 Tax=Candidatus Walczuchella monophlebidarum TaxID=1415657 RepID=A0A068DNV6_9FLAO|nr:type II CAAX endopeptidase family protein [Candidatus Walczuchella monophlebidarum]AID37435.1 putative CAAX amino terminal protease family protein [Candidatus Walczuchella monophlebidarum]